MAMSVSRAGKDPSAGVPDPAQVQDLLRGPSIPRGALNAKSKGLPSKRTAAGGPCPECGHAQSKHDQRGGCMAGKKSGGGRTTACPCTRMFRAARRVVADDDSADYKNRYPQGQNPAGTAVTPPPAGSPVQGPGLAPAATGVPQGNPQPVGGGAVNTNPGLYDPATGIQAPALAPAGSPSSAVPAGLTPGLAPSSASDNVPAADPPAASKSDPSPPNGSSTAGGSSSGPTPDSGNNDQTRRDELGLGNGAFNGADAAMSFISPLVNTGIGMASGLASGLGSGIGGAISGVGNAIGSGVSNLLGTGLGLLSHRTAAAVEDFYRTGEWEPRSYIPGWARGGDEVDDDYPQVEAPEPEPYPHHFLPEWARSR